jgi:hypothetical protein
MVKPVSWLSITPEPERELPEAVATLSSGGAPTAEAVTRERARIEQLVLHGSERQWLAYLAGVVELIDRTAASVEGNDLLASAHARALAVIANHHNLLLALPGRAAELTASDRARLAATETEQRKL